MSHFSPYLITMIVFLSMSATGCGNKSSPVQKAPEVKADDATPVPIMASLPDGWTELRMTANWAKTSIDSMGHFTTSRNACGKEAYGSLPLDVWNTLVQSANKAVKSAALPEEACFSFTPSEKGKQMDGTVEATVGSGKRMLYNYNGGDTCSGISDSDVSKQLLETLSQIVQLADIEECPHGWGS